MSIHRETQLTIYFIALNLLLGWFNWNYGWFWLYSPLGIISLFFLSELLGSIGLEDNVHFTLLAASLLVCMLVLPIAHLGVHNINKIEKYIVTDTNNKTTLCDEVVIDHQSNCIVIDGYKTSVNTKIVIKTLENTRKEFENVFNKGNIIKIVEVTKADKGLVLKNIPIEKDSDEKKDKELK